MKPSDPRHRKFSQATSAALVLPLAFVVALAGWRATMAERQVIVAKPHATPAVTVAAMPAVRDLSVPAASDVRFVDRHADADEEATTF